MKKFLHKIKLIILYGGLEKEQYKLISDDLAKKNRTYLFYFSLISTIVFGILLILSNHLEDYYVNKVLYGIMFIISAVLLINYILFTKKSKVLTHICAYAFLTMLSVAGIWFTLTDIEEKTTMYLVFIAAIPMLFTLRPVHIIIFEFITEICYIILLTKYGDMYEMYSINLFNSIAIFATGLLNGINILYEKTISIYNANRNKYLLETDVMTGLRNRRSFEEQVDLIKAGKEITGVVSFDVNGLKGANDNIGHHAGDELICGAADCIKTTFGPYGECYRTGGDEYMAILFKAFETNEICRNFASTMANWHGKYNKTIHVLFGLVKVNTIPGNAISEITKTADNLMYKDKSDYYVRNHLERRKG